MSTRNRFYNAVKRALEKERWQITHDPLIVGFGTATDKEIDLGLEKVIGAATAERQIAVAVASFLSDSAMFDFHLALGQYVNCRLALEAIEPVRTLYLAVPNFAYDSSLSRDLPQTAIGKYQVGLIVYDPIEEVNSLWL